MFRRSKFFNVTFWLAVVATNAMAVVEERLELSPDCPPSFELTLKEGCKLRTLYQFYTSNQNRGVGGTQTSLPSYRDGFSPQQIDLGRYLFFDPLLSGNNSQSCATCHIPELAFTDGRAVSIGAEGEVTERSSPSLWNSAFLKSFFWDARVNSLEQQALGPLFSPKEMNSNAEELQQKLSANTTYLRFFAEAFPDNPTVSIQNIATALSAFQSSLISLNSRYDQYAHGNHAALNDDEIAGMNIFRSFVARCAECHTPPLFTNNQIAVIGTPEPAGMPFDIGAEKTFNSSKLKGGFKVPSLRNIALTAPYMHSGGFENLRDVAEFYTKGRGHAVPQGLDLQLHWHIWEPGLTSRELDLIVLFLNTLTDQRFLPVTPSSVPSGLPLK